MQRNTTGTFKTDDRTAIGPDTGGVVVNVFYKQSRVRQCPKDSRAARIETVVNVSRDLGCNARPPNLAELQARTRAVKRRILEAERVDRHSIASTCDRDRTTRLLAPGARLLPSPRAICTAFMPSATAPAQYEG